MNRVRTWVFLVCAAACQAVQPPAATEDAGVVEYQGETSNGPLPLPQDVPPDEPWEEDAGAWVVDRRCCEVVFQIDDVEPELASGVVRASMEGLRDGLALTRADGGWTAGYCMPLNAVVPYRYEFSWADPDAGADSDGGVVTIARASRSAFSTHDGMGGEQNVYVVAEDCGAADASVTLRP